MSYGKHTSTDDRNQVQAENLKRRVALGILPLIDLADGLPPELSVASQGEIEFAEELAEKAAELRAARLEMHGRWEAGAVAERSVASTADRTADTWAVGEGSSTSNTGPSGSHNEKYAGGIDTLELSWEGEWASEEGQSCNSNNNNKSKQLTKLLKAIQAVKDRMAIENQQVGEICFGGTEAAVRPRGFMRGPWYFGFVIEWRGVTIGFRDAATPDGFANVFLKFSSATLMGVGPRVARRLTAEMLAGLGFKITKETVSRIDACIDIPNLSPDQLTRMVFNRQRCAQSRKIGYHEDGHLTGFFVGKRNGIHLRVYDKARELLEKPDANKQALLQARWGGQCEFATRAEFQLPREDLRECWNVGDLEDALNKMPEILEYLTNDWFRLTEEEISDRERELKHQARYETASVWKEIARLFQVVFALDAEPPELDWERLAAPSQPTKILKMGLGCFSSVMAKMRLPCDSVAQVRIFFDRIASEYGGHLVDQAQSKLAEMAAAHPLGRRGLDIFRQEPPLEPVPF